MNRLVFKMNPIKMNPIKMSTITRFKHTIRNTPQAYSRYYMKYCLGKDEYVNMDACECITKCKIMEDRKITIHTSTVCSLTNTYKKLGDCKCEDTCSASDSEMYLYHEDECA